MGAVKRSGVPV